MIRLWRIRQSRFTFALFLFHFRFHQGFELQGDLRSLKRRQIPPMLLLLPCPQPRLVKRFEGQLRRLERQVMFEADGVTIVPVDDGAVPNDQRRQAAVLHDIRLKTRVFGFRKRRQKVLKFRDDPQCKVFRLGIFFLCSGRHNSPCEESTKTPGRNDRVP